MAEACAQVGKDGDTLLIIKIIAIVFSLISLVASSIGIVFVRKAEKEMESIYDSLRFESERAREDDDG